ncbi:LuxR family maltose regulon positive regulatory protein [Cellulomonas humilata]|uniref:LuxR family maltose regulon positive regulatory protein n=2 Tax=Cellulomonas humilata TaxID=144055 RepID=A0ABU0EGX5_9CELL|nr:LuxR family maltose regulon positive regulatory protein [Cellulomonas humilata]
MASPARVVAIVAGPGYGKSAVLGQWADRLASAAVWHTCTDADNDPAALLTALGGAAGAGPGIVTVAGLVQALPPDPARTLLVEGVHVITSAGSLNVLSDVIDRLPDTWRVGVSSRAKPRLPIARLRAAGDLLELGVPELSLGPDEAAQVLARSGVTLSPTATAELLDRTEGWPVAVSLAGMALRADGTRTFTGDDVFMREYLRTEVLAGLGGRDTALLVRCAILDELSGPLCDTVLRVRSSGAALEHLAAHGVIQPVGRDGDRFRCHPLLRDLLGAELHRKEPALVPELHRRAARWYADADVPDQAIDHAHRAGDIAEFTRLVLDWSQQTWVSGGIDSVHKWMSWLEEANTVSAFPAIAAHAALIFALVGEPARAERWSAIAKGVPATGTLSDGSTIEATLAYLDAIEARQGTEQMRRDARTAWEGLSPGSPLRATMRHTEALADLLDGDLDRADDLFVEAQEAAEAAGIGPLAAMVLCERASIAVERGDWSAAERSVAQATSIVTDGAFGSYWSSALVFAWAARIAVHLGLRSEAVEHTRRALALRPLLTYGLPVVSTQALLATAQASLGLGDLHAAASTARQAEEIVRRRPGLGDLPDKVATLVAAVQETANQGRPDTLTPAEVRLLPLLATHLTFPLIAERLGVSRNTVKTQAISTYRKLGVTSRNEAVARWEVLDGS